MTPTSDERRDVAARLRENASKHGVTLDYFGSTQVASWWLLLHTIGCESNEQEVAFRMLADLIDPTCELDAIAGGIDAEMVELPRDRDGAPIHVGDTVWTANKDAVECTVESIELYEDITKIFTSSRGTKAIVGPTDVTHTRPDSWERIADELDAWCDGADVDGDACDTPRDLAERIRELAEKEDK